MYSEEVDSKRAEMRVRIRRRQVDELFETTRLRVAEEAIREEQQLICSQLDSKEKQRDWIFTKANQLVTTPSHKWFGILRELSISTKGFEKDYRDWIDSGVVGTLTELLRQQNKHLKLGPIAACILTDIFLFVEDVEQVKRIMEYEFVLDLVELCVPMEEPTAIYWQLIGAIIYSRYEYRDLFINNGLVQVLTTKLKLYQDLESDQVQCALTVVLRLCRSYEISGVVQLPKSNVVALVIPIMDNYLARLRRSDSVELALKIMAAVAKGSRQTVLSHLFHCNGLMEKVMEFFVAENQPMQRWAAISIVASVLTSSKSEYPQELLRRGLLDRVLACSRMKNNRQQTLVVLSQIVSNLVTNGLEEAQRVMEHEVFGLFIIPMARSQDLREYEHALYCLGTIAQYKVYKLSETLVRQYGGLGVFMEHLSRSKPNPTVVNEILWALINLVQTYDRVYTGDNNKIVVELENFYGIQNVLAVLEENTGCARIQAVISTLLELMHGS